MDKHRDSYRRTPTTTTQTSPPPEPGPAWSATLSVRSPENTPPHNVQRASPPISDRSQIAMRSASVEKLTALVAGFIRTDRKLRCLRWCRITKSFDTHSDNLQRQHLRFQGHVSWDLKNGHKRVRKALMKRAASKMQRHALEIA